MFECTTAIIGYGYMGEIRQRILEDHPNYKLSIICEKDQLKVSKINSIEVTDDPQYVIDSNVNSVFICTPNYLIPDLAIKCLESGKHVFCEKPPGRNLVDIEKMITAEKKNPNTKLMFGFNHRYHPSVLKAKSIVDSGRLGNIIALRGIYGKSGGLNYNLSWRNDFEKSGGGILLDQGIHMLDLFNMFLGGFDKIKSFISNIYWEMEVEDNAIVILKNKKNQLATLHSSATFWKHLFQLNILLDKGYLKLDGLLSKSGSYGREKLVIGKRQFEDETEAIGNPSEETIYFDKDLSWQKEINYFIDCIQNNTTVNQSNSEDAWKAMELVQRSYYENDLSIYRAEK